MYYYYLSIHYVPLISVFISLILFPLIWIHVFLLFVFILWNSSAWKMSLYLIWKHVSQITGAFSFFICISNHQSRTSNTNPIIAHRYMRTHCKMWRHRHDNDTENDDEDGDFGAFNKKKRLQRICFQKWNTKAIYIYNNNTCNYPMKIVFLYNHIKYIGAFY